MIQRHVFVTGRVQGVGFRAFVFHSAAQFPNLTGFVRNLPDGRVEAVFAGPTEEVFAAVAACKKGPPGSNVSHIEVKEEECVLDLGKFQILRSNT